MFFYSELKNNSQTAQFSLLVSNLIPESLREQLDSGVTKDLIQFPENSFFQRNRLKDEKASIVSVKSLVLEGMG